MVSRYSRPRCTASSAKRRFSTRLAPTLYHPSAFPELSAFSLSLHRPKLRSSLGLPPCKLAFPDPRFHRQHDPVWHGRLLDLPSPRERGPRHGCAVHRLRRRLAPHRSGSSSQCRRRSSMAATVGHSRVRVAGVERQDASIRSRARPSTSPSRGGGTATCCAGSNTFAAPASRPTNR